MNQDNLLVLIDQIYEAATDPAHWLAVLQSVADAFGAEDASLCGISTQSIPWLVAPRTDPGYLRSYALHYHALNLFWQQMTRVSVGTAVTDSMVLPKSMLHASPFFNEWSRPQRYLSVMGATLLAEDGWRVEFVVPGRSEFGERQLKLYSVLAPHLKRAVQVNHRLQAAALDRAYSLSTLDSLEQGVIIVDSAARILFANAAASNAFNGGLKLADGMVSTGLSSETATLHLAIAACMDAPLKASRDHLAVSRGPDRAPLSLLVIPLRSKSDLIAGRQQAAIIFIADPERIAGPDDAQLRQRFGLTRAEAAFVREMLKGCNTQETADNLGITIATARTHVHRILTKTGTKRQADLMRLLLDPANWVGRDGHTL